MDDAYYNDGGNADRDDDNYSSVCPYIENQDDEDAEDEYASLTSRLMMMSYDRGQLPE